MPQNKIITEHYIATTIVYALIGRKQGSKRHTPTVVVDRGQGSAAQGISP